MRLPAAILVLGLIVTVMGWREVRLSATTKARLRFDRMVDHTREALEGRIAEHGHVLRGIRGLFAASKSVERGEFRQYVGALQRPSQGELGYGFIRRVRRPDLDSFLAATRSDEAPGFQLTTSGDAPELYVIEYIEPLADNRAAEGVDLGQEPARALAARRAVEEDRLALTDRISLVQDQRKVPGFLLLLPVYRLGLPVLTPAQRWNALVGWAYTPLRVDDLMRGVNDGAAGQIDFEVFSRFQEGRGRLLFDADGHLGPVLPESDQAPDRAGRTFHSTTNLTIGGETWTLAFSTRPEFDWLNRSSAQWFVLFGGGLISVLAAGMARILVAGRTRAMALAERMTAELREENQRREKIAHVLQEVSNFQSALLDGAAHAIIATTPEGVIRAFNPAAECLLGWREAEVVGKQTPGIFHDPRELAARAREFGEQLGVPLEPGFDVVIIKSCRGLPNEHEWTYIRKDGSRVPVLLSVSVLRDESGAPTGYLGMALDITERKRVEAEVIQAREMAERALHEVGFQKAALDQHAIVSITDLTGRIVYANDNFCAISGYARDELLGASHRIVNSGTHSADFWRDMWTKIARGSTWTGEICNRAKNGALYWVKATIVPFRDARGSIERYVAIRTDITERKRREAELIELRDAAEAATRAKSSFLATMSHEIRTPMNGVLGFTNLLLDTPLTDAQREHVRIIQNSGQNLLTVINDILDYSKIEAGRIELETILYDLEQASGECLELLAGRAEEKGLALVLEIAPDVPRHLTGDPGRVRQVLLNFVGNAIKFTERGHVLVSISSVASLPHHPGRAGIRVAVQDTGIGIPRDKQGELFTKFTQADSSTSRRFGGTGLGLAICKQLVELMGGQVGLESAPGTGSVFWFTLPTDEHPAASRSSSTPPPWRGARVLVVDDIEINRRVVLTQLRHWDTPAEEAIDGPSALALLRAAAAEGRPFDVVLTDHCMPGMDGEQLGLAVRGDPALAATALVMITSSAQRGESVRLRSIGFCAYMAKPLVRLAVLSRALDFAWQDRNARRTGSPPAAADSSAQAGAGRGGGAGTLNSAAPVQLPAGGVSRTPDGSEYCDVPIHRVLVVEDTIVNQKLARHLLTRMGCRVDLAANGVEAVQMTGQFHYDLVFMDCHMPEMDGYEAARRIREREQGQTGIRPLAGGTEVAGRVPIVALTAGAMDEDRERCRTAGMDDFVTKPFMPSDLSRALARWSRSLRSRLSA